MPENSVKTISTGPNQNSQICDAVAIDIGTSKCRLAICKDKYIQIIEHESNRAIPSYVALTKSLTEKGEEEWYVGRMAENYAFCLSNVVYDIRWLLGKKVGDVKKDEKNYFFEMNYKDNIKADVQFLLQRPTSDQNPQEPINNEPIVKNPDEILSKLLESILTTAFEHVKPLINNPPNIVITFPLNADRKLWQEAVNRITTTITREFYERLNRQNAAALDNATKNLADEVSSEHAPPKGPIPTAKHTEGGQPKENKSPPSQVQPKSEIITKPLLIREPLAVAAAYAPRLNLYQDGSIALVFCLGAGYLQVIPYLIKPKSDLYEIQEIVGIKTVTSDKYSGVHFDNLIYDEMINKINGKEQKEHFKPKLNPRAQRRLRIACEKMKCALSFAPHTRIDVDSLYRNADGEDIDFTEVIKKEDIQGYINEPIKRIMEEIEKVYSHYGFIPDFILLGGGSTRIPLITEGLAKIFDPSKTMICNFLNVDEVAATGAAAIVSKSVEIAKTMISCNDVKELLAQRKIAQKRTNRTPPPVENPTKDPANTVDKNNQKLSSNVKEDPHDVTHVKSDDKKSPTSPNDTSDNAMRSFNETPNKNPVDTQRSDEMKPKEGLQGISKKESRGSQKSRDGKNLPVTPNSRSQSPANLRTPTDKRYNGPYSGELDKSQSKTRQIYEKLLAEDKANNGAEKNIDHREISLSGNSNNSDGKTAQNPDMKGQPTSPQHGSPHGSTNPSMTDNFPNEGHHSNAYSNSVPSATTQPPSSQQRGNSSKNHCLCDSCTGIHKSSNHGNSSSTQMALTEYKNTPALRQNAIPTDSSQSQHDHRQPGRDGSTIQGTSRQLAEQREVVEALRPENNCYYHKWNNDKYGQSYIDLFLNKMATEYPVRYLIDPAILDFKKCYHIICEPSYVSNTMWWYSKEQTFFQYYVIREIRIELIEYNHIYRTYKCKIIVVHVNSNNYEGTNILISHTRRTFKEWLEYKLRLEIGK